MLWKLFGLNIFFLFRIIFLLNKKFFNCHVNQSYQKIVFWGISIFGFFLEFYNIERGGSEIIVAFYSVKVLLFDWIELIGVKQCDQLTFNV